MGPPFGHQLERIAWAIKALTSATAAVGLATGPATAQNWTTREPATTAEEDDGAAVVAAAAAGAEVDTGLTAPVVVALDQGHRAAAAAGLAHLHHATAE